MMQMVEALSVASFSRQINDLDHETRGAFAACENGQVWAVLDVSVMGDTWRSAFPCDANGIRGDTRKRGQAGVMWRTGEDALRLVINRSRRMVVHTRLDRD